MYLKNIIDKAARCETFMPRYKLTIEYDGTPFCGWQRQDGHPSVQQSLEEALQLFLGEEVRLYCAGRTDTGVHGLAQVTHVDVSKEWREDVFRNAANACLRRLQKEQYGEVSSAPFVSVLSVEEVSEEFHARFSALKRHYLYRILNRRAPSALNQDRVWHQPRLLNCNALQEAAQVFVGAHDFTTFRASQCQAKSPFRTLDVFQVERVQDEIRFYVSARSFLHNQIRGMVGTIVQVGLGRWSVEDVRSALEAKDRTRCGPQAPACGLYFVGVDYPEVLN